jgi:hypothetical protein
MNIFYISAVAIAMVSPDADVGLIERTSGSFQRFFVNRAQRWIGGVVPSHIL